MPIPQTIRVNPLDLNKNIAIGVSLPFKGPFNSTYATKDQIKSNLINLLLTNKGERVMNPNFGCNIKNQLFESISPETEQNIIDSIVEAVNTFIPEVQLLNITVVPDTDLNQVSVTIDYEIILSNTPGQITIQFETLR